VHQDISTPAYYPYDNRSTTRQIDRKQTIFSYPCISSFVFPPDLSLLTSNIMHFLFFQGASAPTEPTDEHTLVPLHAPERNTSDGAEFLDDAIRMEDVIIHTEESVAAGSPANLL
jgi:hypothetical protein